MWRHSLCALALSPLLAIAQEPAANTVSAEQAVAALPVGAGDDVIGMLGSLLLMAALLFAGLWFLRRLRGLQRPQQAGVAVVSQIPLGMKEKLLVLQVGEERLLVGCTPASMQTLHRWDAEALPEQTIAATGDFAALLKKRLAGKGEEAQR
ncbi:flagellar biosynthetic protein FliO [Spongiibacter tropicus]|uniref:flagellar biosynthetic protein FliO n=1 Tax=Spongiibacter tropicus TaxID=454602 RepID=UPI0035BE9429